MPLALNTSMPLALNISRGCEELPLAYATYSDPSPVMDGAAADLTRISALNPSDVLDSDVSALMETSLGADILTAAQADYQARQEGLVLTVSSSSNSGFANVQLKLNNGMSRYRARLVRHGVRLCLGYFSTPEEAALHVARAQAQASLDDTRHLLSRRWRASGSRSRAGGAGA